MYGEAKAGFNVLCKIVYQIQLLNQIQTIDVLAIFQARLLEQDLASELLLTKTGEYTSCLLILQMKHKDTLYQKHADKITPSSQYECLTR